MASTSQSPGPPAPVSRPAADSSHLACVARRRVAERWGPLLPPELVDGLSPRWAQRPMTRADVAAWWRRLAALRARGEAPTLIMGYVHVPFCRTLCGFCQFSSRLARGPEAHDRYLDALEAEAEAVIAATGRLPVAAATMGGGTPSALSAPRLARLLNGLTQRWLVVPPDAWFSVEANPDSLSPAKAQVLVDAGVTRVSVGVQSLNPAVLRGVQRGYQRPEMVAAAVAAIRDASRRGAGSGRAAAEGAPVVVSADLLAPLPGETEESFRAGARYLLAQRPDVVVLYVYQQAQKGRRVVPPGPMPFAVARQAFLDEAASRGYLPREASGPSVVVERPGTRRFPTQYVQHARQPASILGLGPYAESYLFGVGQYVAGPDLPPPGVDGPAYRGASATRAQDLRRSLVRRLGGGEAVADDDLSASLGGAERGGSASAPAPAPTPTAASAGAAAAASARQRAALACLQRAGALTRGDAGWRLSATEGSRRRLAFGLLDARELGRALDAAVRRQAPFQDLHTALQWLRRQGVRGLRSERPAGPARPSHGRSSSNRGADETPWTVWIATSGGRVVGGAVGRRAVPWEALLDADEEAMTRALRGDGVQAPAQLAAALARGALTEPRVIDWAWAGRAGWGVVAVEAVEAKVGRRGWRWCTADACWNGRPPCVPTASAGALSAADEGAGLDLVWTPRGPDGEAAGPPRHGWRVWISAPAAHSGAFAVPDALAQEVDLVVSLRVVYGEGARATAWWELRSRARPGVRP